MTQSKKYIVRSGDISNIMCYTKSQDYGFQPLGFDGSRNGALKHGETHIFIMRVQNHHQVTLHGSADTHQPTRIAIEVASKVQLEEQP